MKFQYVAYTTLDGVIKGEIDAPNETEANAAIALQGYKALSVDPVRRLPPLEEIFPSLFKTGTADLVRFSRHLATMVRGGSSLQRALEMMQSETSNRVMRKTIQGVRESLDQGGSLTDGLSLYPRVFDTRYISVVEVGEFTGSLAPALVLQRRITKYVVLPFVFGCQRAITVGSSHHVVRFKSFSKIALPEEASL